MRCDGSHNTGNRRQGTGHRRNASGIGSLDIVDFDQIEVGNAGEVASIAGKERDVTCEGDPRDKTVSHTDGLSGDVYKRQLLSDAIRDAKGNSDPITLIVVNTGTYKVLALDYHDGLKYPHLERVDGTPDRLDDILKPMTEEPKVHPGM